MGGRAFCGWLVSLFTRNSEKAAPEGNGNERMSSAPRDGSARGNRERPAGWAELDEREIADILIHRTQMRGINAEDPPEVSVRTILGSPFTRMPVWKDSIDNIIGVLHAKDMLRALAEPGATPEKLDIVKIAEKPWFVPDTTSLREQLNAFLKRNTPFAVVVDEYGEVQGIVTIQDILEDVLGDIADERDVGVTGVRKEADGSIVVDGDVTVRDLNRALGWSLPDSEATTIAGLVIHESRSIPEERQAFTFHGKRFTVMKRIKNRITRLRIRPVA
ncbi:CBS domain-containing protein [Rhizobium sp. KVB221]|uniref:CBS domain-containing protein n=1 Tax=Rhizobium setariae TaxID=2801340 RepID=A0A937CPB1_9HYPH|nr:CBS domain-containing protein [Rhizobium setariae]